MQLRITSGTAKNKKILVPDIPNFRAVQEVVKLAVFSILDKKVENSICLDLYAGSGNMGLEALSRGAAWCDLVDDNWNSKQAILKNIKDMGFDEKAEFHFSDSVKFVGNTDKKYDIIFADPFYETTSHKFLIKNLDKILNKSGIIFFMHGNDLKMDQMVGGTDLKIIDERRFGKSLVTTLKKGEGHQKL